MAKKRTFLERLTSLLRGAGAAVRDSNEETAALLNWMVRNLNDVALPRNFVDYTAADIQRLRAHPLAEVGVTRTRLRKAAAAKAREGQLQ